MSKKGVKTFQSQNVGTQNLSAHGEIQKHLKCDYVKMFSATPMNKIHAARRAVMAQKNAGKPNPKFKPKHKPKPKPKQKPNPNPERQPKPKQSKLKARKSKARSGEA